MSARKRLKGRSVAAQWLLLGAALLTTGGFIAWNLYAEREAAEVREREQLANHARVIDENLGQQLRTINLALESVRSDLHFLRSQKDGSELLIRRLRSTTSAMPELRSLHILDAQGVTTASNRADIIGRDFHERDYFHAARQNNNPAVLHVTPPYGNANGVYTMTLTKSMQNQQGGFAGAVAATLAPEYFNTLLNSTLYAADMRASIVHGDGQIFLNSPPRPDGNLANIAKPGTFFTRHRESGQQSSLFSGIVYSSGDARMIALRTVEIANLQMDKPLVVATSRDLPTIFAPWRKGAYEQGGLFLLLVLISSLGLYVDQKRRLSYDRVIADDDAKRLQAEENLRGSEARFRSLTAMSSDFYWESDNEHRLTTRTESKREAAEAVFVSAPAIGRRRWEATSLSPDEAGWRKHREALAAHLPFRDFEIARLRSNGTVHHISVSGDPVFDASGQFKGYRGVGADITERKRSERLLSLEHAIARSLALGRDASSGLIAVMRAICETMSWDRSTYWRADDAAGVMRFQEYWDTPGLRDLESYTEHSRKVVFASGEGLVGRVWQTGEPIWVADFANDPRVVQQALGREIGAHGVFVFPVNSEGRTIGALAFFCREVREPDARMLALTRVIGSELGQYLQRIDAEDRVLRLNADLEQRVIERTHALEVANKELEAYSYSVSHDLRAPLRAIQGFSSLVEKQYAAQIDEDGRNMLRRVGAAAIKMGRLIDDLLNLSQISRQDMHLGPVDLSALAWEVIGELQAEAPERKVEWVISPQVSGEGDAGLLRVVLQNLIGNAWKYSAKRESARIEFGECDWQGGRAYFVRDNGAGFDAKYADKLFGAFQRLHSPGEFSGTGIGLATVKRVIHRHGGQVGAQGNEGEGAVFYFTL